MQIQNQGADLPLSRILADEITGSGPIPFARFMDEALYHPRYGYYVGGALGSTEPLGWTGDYLTSSDIHPLWGRMLARQLVEMWEALGRPRPFVVAEPGAGRGLLAVAVWRYALTEAPEFASTLRYVLADRAPEGTPLRARREERLAHEVASLAIPADGLRWVDDLTQVFAPRSLTGVIVSNELFDALPVHVVRKRGDTLEEMYVTLNAEETRFIETFRAPSRPDVAAYLDRFGIPWRTFPDGWRAEVNLAAEDWVRRIGNLLGRGFLLTIDYGDVARSLYTRDRRRGTLAVYTHHQFGDNPLAAPGSQDLTAHVNFSALLRTGREVGLRQAGFTTQADFLMALGIREEGRQRSTGGQLRAGSDSMSGEAEGALAYLRAASQRAAVSALLDPYGMGRFRILLQHRGAPGIGARLRGFGGSGHVYVSR